MSFWGAARMSNAKGERKIILFGAGNNGRKAFEFYGKERVAYFVDNNPQKTGQELLGKRVLGFPEYLEISEDYHTVIASIGYLQIIEQLEQNAVGDYSVFMGGPICTDLMTKLREPNITSVALYGVDVVSKTIFAELKDSDVFCKIKYVTAPKDSNHIGEKVGGMTVVPLEEIMQQIDCVVISSKTDNVVLQLQADQLMKGSAAVLNPFESFRFYGKNELLITQYRTEKPLHSEEEYNSFISRLQNENGLFDMIDKYVETAMRDVPLFRYVEIETVNRCNGVCEFCPVNRFDDIREEKWMSDTLFRDIIGQLERIHFNGALSLYSNNEPLLDERIIDFYRYARKALPNAYLFLFTNGTLLGLDKFIALADQLDELIIDYYSVDGRLLKTSATIKEYIENERPELVGKVTIVLRNPKEILSTRGGDAPNRNNKVSYGHTKCTLPFRQIVIRPDGKVSLCCNDPLGKCTLGDLAKESIMDAWFGEKYAAVRKAISKGRNNYWHCEYCDYFRI
jgi:MoaA/NifB/PqqE/SkfB family radical SAM enzyme